MQIVLFQTIKFSISTQSDCQKHLYFKQFIYSFTSSYEVKQDVLWTDGEVKVNSFVTFSYELLRIDTPVLTDR